MREPESTIMKNAMLAGLALAGLLGMAWVSAQEVDPGQRTAAARIAVGTCATCHGRQGHSISPKFPVLAGQHAPYLVAQLHAFKTQTRGDPDALGYMWGMAAPLDDDVIVALADYYSRQTPRAGIGQNSALIARGKQLYQSGAPAQGIPSCAVCHGPNAEGTDAFPRLAGQHVQYLLKQLRSFKTNLRNVAVMHGVAQGLQSGEMRAVSAYLESLGS